VEIDRALATGPADGVYDRYALTADGISPRRLPGFGPVVVADSDEHTPDGHLTEDLEMRVKMQDKRLRKLTGGQRAGRHHHRWPGRRAPDPGLLGLQPGSGSRSGGPLNAESTRPGWCISANCGPSRPGGGQVPGAPEKTGDGGDERHGQFNRLLRQETGIAADHLVLKYDGAPLTPEYILRALAGHT